MNTIERRLSLGVHQKIAPQGRRNGYIYSAVYAVISIALIKPDSLPYIGLGLLENILVAVDLALLLFLLCAFFVGKLRLSSITIAVTLFFLSIVPATLLGSQDFGLFTRMAGPAIAVCMLTDFAIPRHPRIFLNGMTLGLFTAYTANFVSIIAFYPDGMYTTQRISGGLYLMGFDNGMIYGLLPLCVYALVRCAVTRDKRSTIVAASAVLIMLASIIYVMAVSSILGAICLLSVMLLGMLNAGHLGSNLKLGLFLGWICLAVLIVVRRRQGLIPIEVTELFGKDETLTGRTELWDYALEKATEHPLLGVGLGEWLRGPSGHFYPHPHSMLVDAIYTGGFLGTLAWCGVAAVVVILGVRSAGSWVNTAIVGGSLGLLIMEVANSVQFKALFWGVLVLLAHSDRLSTLAGQPNHEVRELSVWRKKSADSRRIPSIGYGQQSKSLPD